MPWVLARRRLLVGAAAAVGMAVSAAGGQGAGGARAARQNGRRLRYQLVAASPNEVPAAQDLIDRTFGERFPGIEVIVEPAPEGRDERLAAAMTAGDAPAVFDTWRDDVVKYAGHGQVLDLTPLIGRDLPPEEVADFFP